MRGHPELSVSAKVTARRFRVLVRGTNLLLQDVDTSKVERLGFYATRYVEAVSDKAARSIALAAMAREMESIRPKNRQGDPPCVEIDAIDELESLEGIVAGGFSFFPDDPN